ncbi:Putative ribonuclease H protein At1g65750 [Linum perenne]
MAFLENLPPSSLTAGPAAVVWPLDQSSSFSVRSLRNSLTSERCVNFFDFPKEVIWSNPVPPKIQGFCWMVWHKKITSVDNLQRRGMSLANRCVVCEQEEESVDHLFVNCQFALEVWDRVSSKLSLVGPRLDSVRGLFSAWKCMNFSVPFSEVSLILLHSILWYIWLERNERVFNDKSRNAAQVTFSILCNLGRWLGTAKVFSAASLTHWNFFIFDPG